MNTPIITTRKLPNVVGRCVALLTLVLLSTTGRATAGNALFENYSRAEGLTHKFIYNIIRDEDGFIWIASSSGLSRFDSYMFENYANNIHNSNFLEGTSIFGIAEGKGRRIWLSTDEGLGYFDKTKEKFILIDNHVFKGMVFKKDMSVDECGRVWLFNQNLKFVLYDPQKDSVVKQIPDYSGWRVDKDFYIIRFLVANDILWISSNEGIGMYDLKKKRFTFIDKNKLTHCHTIRRADDNTIVVTYMFEGVYVVDISKKTSVFIKKSFIEDKIGVKTSLFDAVTDADGTLWVSVSPGMVSIKNSEVNYYGFDSRQRYFSGDVASCMYRDGDNNLWIGTYGDGIFLKKKNNSKFNFATRLYKGDIKKTPISSFTVFQDGSLLYRDSKGIYVCPDYRKLTIDCATQIFSSSASYLFPVDDRYAMISSLDTFYVYDSRKRSMSRSFVGLAPSSVFKDKSGVTWTGTWHGYLYGYDGSGKKKYDIALDSLNKTQYPIIEVRGGGDGSLWLGTSGLGVVHIIDPKAAKPVMEYYNKSGKGKLFLSSNTINCLHLDEAGDLWIGTNGAGLLKLDRETGEIETFTTRNGLKSNIIESVISDNDGNIWFASVVLSKYDIKKKVFTHFSNVEGINSSFVPKASHKTLNGDLLFANTNGIYSFNPGDSSVNEKISAPLLTNLRIRGASVFAGDSIDGFVYKSNSITYSDVLDLPYFLNTFAIEFASIYFQESQTINYEYMLEGIDRSWIPADTRTRLASYSGLQPGTYVFKVRASFGAGKWSKERILHVKITPPWWKTCWFRSISSVFVASLVSLIFIYRTRSLKRQNARLEHLVSKRTHELKVANESLMETTQALDSKNKNLEENQLVIEMRNLDLNEALHAKDELLKVVSHDIKNPLAGIIGMAGLLKNEATQNNPERVKRFVDSILSSATSLVNQMATVLDWAQSLNKDLTANPIEINLDILLDDAISLVRENAVQKNISITKQLEYETNALVDPRMISTVFRNLLSNAIKFTHAGGSILVLIQEFDNGIDVVFIDTGIGISDEMLRQLFNPNLAIKCCYGTANEKGTGIGLQVCKSFVEKNSGRIQVSSQEGRGATFSVTLPKGQNKATAKSQSNITVLQSSTLKPGTDEKMTILVIDDNVEIREIIHEVFDGQYTVVKAEDGNEGMHIAQNILPDVIISDVNLPGKNGIDICKTLKNNDLTSHIPILLITSQQGNDIETKGFESGANDFIEKPFNPYSLRQKVIALLVYRNQIRDQIRKSFEVNKPANLPLDYDSKIIKKVITLIEDNLSDPELDTETVANRIGVSRTQLWRIFKHTTGKTLGDYIREIRLQKASEMLRTGKFRVSEVAYEVGYSDSKNFTRNFLKEFGLTPSQYIDSVKI